MDLVISHLPYVVTGTGVLTDQNIAIENGRIAAITPDGERRYREWRAPSARTAGTPPTTDSTTRTIDGRTLCAMPSFKNAHTHAAMTLLRGFGDDMRLQDWLQGRIWPAEASLDGTDIYWGTRLAALEMVRSGTTFANDMYFFFPEAFQAFTDAGIRGAVGLALFDFFDADRRREQQTTVDVLLNRFAGTGASAGNGVRKAADSDGTGADGAGGDLGGVDGAGGDLGGADGAEGPRVFPTLAPHSIYTCSPELLRWAAGRSRELGLVYHIHMSETQREVDDCIAAHGVRPWQWLEQIGVLAEIAGRGIAAHGIWLDDSELKLIADYGITLAHNPASNMKLSSGAFDWARVREREIPVMLAPDGVASNNNLDMFDEMKLAALMQKHTFGEPTRLPAHEVIRLATGGYSDVFSPWGVGGGLTVGAPADIALVNLEDPQMTPVHNIESNLAYAANGSMVDTVICGGKVVMEHRTVADAAEVLREARRRAETLAVRADSGA